MSELTIRRANLDDALAIAEVYVASARPVERGIIPDAVLDAMTPADYVDSWVRRLSPPEPNATWIAERDGQAVGIAYVEPSPDDDATPTTGHLDMLYVLPEHAGRGIGSRLLTLGVEHLCAAGCTEATLWALAANERTQRFYRREGWIATGHEQTIAEEDATYVLRRYAIDLTTERERA